MFAFILFNEIKLYRIRFVVVNVKKDVWKISFIILIFVL